MLADIPVRESKYLAFMNEAGKTILVGLAVGGLNLILSLFDLPHFNFDPEAFSDIFTLLLLPPIIFGASFTMKQKNFMSNIGSILTLAVLGTIINAVVMASGLFLIVYTLSDEFLPVYGLICLVFGAALSATDTVAIVAVFTELNIDPLVYSLVFGESVLNDAVAIVLFRTFLSVLQQTDSDGTMPNMCGTSSTLTAGTFALMGGQFLYVSLCSVLVGIVVGAVSAILLKRFKQHLGPPNEILWIIIWAFVAYLCGESLHLSGIIAVFVCGVMMSHYHWYSLTPDAQVSTLNLAISLGNFCDSIALIAIGLFVFRPNQRGVDDPASWNPAFLIAGMALGPIGRAIEVFPSFFLLNLGRKVKVPFSHQIMIWFAGMRGAVALILTLQASTVLCDNTLLINSTLVIVMFTNLVLGPITKPLTRKLNIKTGAPGDNINQRKANEPDDDPEIEMIALNDSGQAAVGSDGDAEGEAGEFLGSAPGEIPGAPSADQRAPMIDGGSRSRRAKRSRFHRFFRHIDDKYIKKWLGGRPRRQETTLPEGRDGLTQSGAHNPMRHTQYDALRATIALAPRPSGPAEYDTDVFSDVDFASDAEVPLRPSRGLSASTGRSALASSTEITL